MQELGKNMLFFPLGCQMAFITIADFINTTINLEDLRDLGEQDSDVCQGHPILNRTPIGMGLDESRAHL